MATTIQGFVFPGKSLIIITTAKMIPRKLIVTGALYPKLAKSTPPTIGAGNAANPRKAARFHLGSPSPREERAS